MTLLRTLLAALTVTLVAVPGFGHEFKIGAIEIEHPWARATAASAETGAAYLELNNHGTAPDRLISAASPIAAKVELHTHLIDNGVMKMRPIDAIEVAPGSPTKLAPGGHHLMLIGLKEPLKKGKSFPLTLTFEKAGAVTVEVAVQGAGDHESDHGHTGHDHPSTKP